VVQPLLTDADLYVRRRAAITAISLGAKEGVDTLLATLDVETLDTGENYGHNLYATMADYLGPELREELGLDRKAWRTWWKEAREAFDLAAALTARKERLAAEK
jgi:hypothetical protein